MTASTPSGVQRPDGGGHRLAARHHVMRAERLDQRLVLRLRVADHGQPAVRAELDRVLPDDAGRPGHGERRPRGQREQVERGAHRQAVHRQRRRLGQRPPVGHRGELVRVDHPVLGLRAAARHHRGDRGHHPVARAPGRRVGPGLLDDAGQVHAGDVRRLDARPAAAGRPAGSRGRSGSPWPPPPSPGPGPGPGDGLGTVTMPSTDGSPNSVKPTARMSVMSSSRRSRRGARRSRAPVRCQRGVAARHSDSSSSTPRRCRCGRLRGRQVVVGVRPGQAGLHRDGERVAAVRHRHLEQRVVADHHEVAGGDAEPGGRRAQRVERRLAGDRQAAAGDRPDHRGDRPGGAERPAARRGEERGLRRASTAPRPTRPRGRRPPGGTW